MGAGGRLLRHRRIAGGGRICLSARSQGAAYWIYPDQGSEPYSPSAAEAAQHYLQANLRGQFAITGFATENGGPGTAQISLRVTVPGSPLVLWRRGPVVVDVFAAADPRYGVSDG